MLDTYVDETFPSTAWGYAQQILLGTAGLDSLGRYRFSHRHILINFTFPELMRDDSVSLLTASLSLCSDASYPAAPFETYGVEGAWGTTTTFNTLPPVDAMLWSGSVGDGTGSRYWTILGTSGFKPLLTRWKARTPMYGVMIQGGLVVPRNFYSIRSPKNTPKLTFTLRY